MGFQIFLPVDLILADLGNFNKSGKACANQKTECSYTSSLYVLAGGLGQRLEVTTMRMSVLQVG